VFTERKVFNICDYNYINKVIMVKITIFIIIISTMLIIIIIFIILPKKCIVGLKKYIIVTLRMSIYNISI